jgi:prevent-host-death family protein
MNHQPRVWQLQEAKARFSELVRRAQTEGPQTVTVHGEAAVVVTAAVRPLVDLNGKTGADFVRALSAGPPLDFELPERPKDGQFRDFSFED